MKEAIKTKEKKSLLLHLKEYIIPISISLVIVLVINKLFFFSITVPSSSMYPTIQPGDKIWVLRIHDFKTLKRGDILVFKSNELQETLIKRLIGLPNENVLVDSHQNVYVNSNKLNEPYVVTNGGVGGTFNIPSESYLFLGDNRVNSRDSRYWNKPYIQRSDIQGIAAFRYFPFNRIGLIK